MPVVKANPNEVNTDPGTGGADIPKEVTTKMAGDNTAAEGTPETPKEVTTNFDEVWGDGTPDKDAKNPPSEVTSTHNDWRDFSQKAKTSSENKARATSATKSKE